MTPRYAHARATATLLLLRQRLYSLRIDTKKLHYDKNILIDSMQHFCHMTSTTLPQLTDGSDCLQDGCTFICRHQGETRHIILYNEDARSSGRLGFTLAHELGHVYLNHRQDGDTQEKEANCFAAQLLAPMVLIHEMARQSPVRLTPEDLRQVFSLSYQAAENRLRELPRHFSPTRDDLALLKKLGYLLPCHGEPLVDI